MALLLPTLTTAVAMNSPAADSRKAPEGPARWNGHWTSNPTAVPSSKTVDGPLLGDGETGVVLGVGAAIVAVTRFLLRTP